MFAKTFALVPVNFLSSVFSSFYTLHRIAIRRFLCVGLGMEELPLFFSPTVSLCRFFSSSFCNYSFFFSVRCFSSVNVVN